MVARSGVWVRSARVLVLVAAVGGCGDDVTTTAGSTSEGSTGAAQTTTAPGSTSEPTTTSPTSGTASMGETLGTTGSSTSSSTSSGSTGEAMTTGGTSTGDASTSGTTGEASTSSTGGGELCGDGIDDDGDGDIDEGCPCAEDGEQACFPFPESGVGTCAPGVQACAEGTWGPCEGAVGPQAELCDMLDDDCDGEVDDMCTCEEGAVTPCYPGPEGTADVGICESGTQTCVVMNGEPTLGPCEGFVLPAAEDACNDMLDNDCDGKVDVKRGANSGVYAGI